MWFDNDRHLDVLIWLLLNAGMRDVDWWTTYHEFNRFSVWIEDTETRLAFKLIFDI